MFLVGALRICCPGVPAAGEAIEGGSRREHANLELCTMRRPLGISGTSRVDRVRAGGHPRQLSSP